MRTMRRLVSAAAAMLLLGSAPHAAAEQDHLLGYKAKDLNQAPAPAAAAVATALANGTCQLKKAKFVLLQAEKDGGDDPRGAVAGSFVCYKAKCADVSGPVAADTQFGNVNMELTKAQILCLPADTQICGDGELDGTEQCDGDADGACPGLCQPDCTCGMAPCAGQVVGGFCWFLGGGGESCTTACANHGLGYSAATATYAGSGGTDANCDAVLTALGGDLAVTMMCNDGYGCMIAGGAGFRCTDPTTAAASFSGGAPVSRACACQ